ncbi:uncharacterized protein LOC111334145 isoform X1 [Stylophora pistillata]|uniref:uncharacterized protein LOC111334145 isoform X1 n=1 Tax=Stylophora pistillata TaxID=50429 RepID=UPI000C041528|nr:uncharacterized protein LOC111334145 isoform X1 [Stylophora pistillata]
MGFEHERIHFETSSVLIRQMPLDLVKKPKGWKNGPLTTGDPVSSNPLIEITERAVSMGKPENFPSYGWDNEYGEWNVKVPPFRASKYLITNWEYLEFVNDGGYEDSKYWTDEGWKWKQFRKLHHPTFWVCGQKCKSGCGGDLATYSHCNLESDVNHNMNGHHNGFANGVANGVANGFANGVANGFANGVADGVTNGVANGVANGFANGVADGVTNGVANGLANGVTNGAINGFANGVLNGDHQNNLTHANGGSEEMERPYKYRAMFEVIDMPMDWPAEVNYHEAKAFCAWKGPDYRLPTEAEHHAMRGPQKSPSEGTICDIIYQDNIKANINMAYGSSTPVNLFPPSKAGFCDVSGNVWEWCEDHFNGLKDFKPHILYDDFSTPCFDGRHNMIMGGSWVSTGGEASRFSRYAFRRHFFQHLGFRLVQSIADSPPVRLVGTPVFVLGVGVEDNPSTVPGIDSSAYYCTTNPQYHDDAEEFLLSEISSHYGDLLGMENNVQEREELVQMCVEAIQKCDYPVKNALEIMCSVGRLSYELSRHFEQVIAIDHSGRLLDAALKIQQGKSLEITSALDKHLSGIPLNKIVANTEKVMFQQFTWLPNEIGTYDVIVMSCLHRLANVKAWLIRLWDIISPKGLLIIKTNITWDLESLKAVLGNKFSLLELRLVKSKREGLRKSDMCHSSVTIWRSKQ